MLTMRFGNIEPEHVFEFKSGLIGFPELQKFTLIKAEYKPFFWLQSLDDGTMAFLVCNPNVFFPEYVLELPEIECKELLVVITMPMVASMATANLLAPIVLDTVKNTGTQVLNKGYHTKHKICGG